MNRRDFLKYICSLLALIPFFPYSQDLQDNDGQELLIGIDKATKKYYKDYPVSFWMVETGESGIQYTPCYNFKCELVEVGLNERL